MTYYSDVQYREKENLWFENLYFNRWFSGNPGPILDIGCATGNFVATHPDIIEGIDVDDDCLRICRQRGLNVQKIDAQYELGYLPADFYSGIYAKQIIEHLDEPLAFLANIHRLLKAGGRAVLLTPNCPYALTRFFWDDYTHKRPFTKVSLRRIALDADFTEIKIYTDFRTFPGLGVLMRTFRLSPELVSVVQRRLLVNGLALIMELEK